MAKGWKSIHVRETTKNLLKALKKKKQSWDSFLLGLAKKSRAPALDSRMRSEPMSAILHQDSPSQSVDTSLEELKKLRLYNRYLVEAYNAQHSEPECNQRFFFEGDYYCAIKAPRATKLISLEICEACKSRQWKLPSEKKKKRVKYPEKEWRDPLESRLPYDNTGKNYMGDT